MCVCVCLFRQIRRGGPEIWYFAVLNWKGDARRLGGGGHAPGQQGRAGLLTGGLLSNPLLPAPPQVWDLVTGACEHTLRCHTDKVQAVAWNPAESPVLLTGSFDRSVCLVSLGERVGGSVGR